MFSREEVERVLELARDGRIEPLVSATFPLDEARAAMEMLERREHFGKILITP